MAVRQNKNGADGVLGNQIGGGSGEATATATALGIFGGAILGNNIEGAPPAQTQTVQNCTTQNIIENWVTGYNVTYKFNGKVIQRAAATRSWPDHLNLKAIRKPLNLPSAKSMQLALWISSRARLLLFISAMHHLKCFKKLAVSNGG
ncbi:glycine zipper 2TM domain-containing protein [Limnohabitans sp. Jir72]|uniref:glycine zipper 2TM domain-containing protein n=1 Tax=Limnohabitans sp. Jir72 TaxID=1977909 RepID=UPI0011B2695C|nr:hypothetical protein [Limnohabitans sp. Jir72]